jgi:hypothetical protein
LDWRLQHGSVHLAFAKLHNTWDNPIQQHEEQSFVCMILVLTNETVVSSQQTTSSPHTHSTENG